MRDDDYTREGWSRRGVRSRLDRRRSLKEAIKRRAVQGEAPVVHERRSALSAARAAPAAGDRGRRVLRDGRLVQHGGARSPARQDLLLLGGARPTPSVRRTSSRCSSRTRSRRGSSRKASSSRSAAAAAPWLRRRFAKILDISSQRFDPGRFNSYVFYASDGANFQNDREPCAAALAELGKLANYIGYVETAAEQHQAPLGTETAVLFEHLQAEMGAAGRYALTSPESVWDAIRALLRSSRGGGGLACKARCTATQFASKPSRASTASITTPCSSRKCRRAS